MRKNTQTARIELSNFNSAKARHPAHPDPSLSLKTEGPVPGSSKLKERRRLEGSSGPTSIQRLRKITVLGDGAWGTAFATLLAHNGHHVKLWCFNKQVAESIRTTRVNSIFLPDIKLPENIEPVTDIVEAVSSADYIFEAIPVRFMRSTLEPALAYAPKKAHWVVLSKGIETKTLLVPTQILENMRGPQKISVIAGPSFAHDLARQQPTAVNISAIGYSATDDKATHSITLAQEIQKLTHTNYFQSYYTSDYLGIQIVSALKNVLALGVGILDALSYGDNTKIYFIMEAASEISKLNQALGGKPETIYSLAGIGDIMLTALGSHSKNLKLGRELGAGLTLAQLEQRSKTLPEGINTALALSQLAHQKNISMPLCLAIYDIIFEKKSPGELVSKLTE